MATTCKLIAKTTLGSTASSIEFTSIPATYTDLLLVCGLRSTFASVNLEVQSRVNGSTSNIYSARSMRANGSAASSQTWGTPGSPTNMGFVGYSPGSSSTSSTFGNMEIYIPNYAGSTAKSYSSTAVNETNATSVIHAAVVAGLYDTTAAISSIQIFIDGLSLATGSSAYVYGITRA